MKISVEQIKEVVETLPIGFYANARVSVQMDNDADTSYFSPNTREIFISPKIIMEGLANVKGENEENTEKLIRGQVYHELSHAILTPKSLHITDITNIFEDERIETLLDDYYHKVDFKWAVKTICDFDNIQPPQDAMNAFYQLVRFRVGKKEFLDEVDNIIKKYRHYNWNTNDSIYYYWDIQELYNKVERDFKQNPQDYQGKDFEEMKDNSEKFGGKGENQANMPSEYSQKQDQENEQGGNGQPQASDTDSYENSENGQPLDDSEQGQPQGQNKKGSQFNAEKIFNNALDQLIDKEFYTNLDMLLASFSKKNNGQGGSVGGYSGVFNPRQVGSEDYRYFQRKTTARTSNKYGSIHLNLFIDRSGSFIYNQDLANKVIRTLIDIEKKYSYFTVDFATCGEYVTYIKDKKKFTLQCGCGTELKKGDLETVKSMQKNNTLNYNIVLYDGDFCKNYYQKFSKTGNAYLPFDTRNTTLILDSSCKRDSEKVKNAKVIISQDYLTELKSNILKALANALR
jgi:hypothetical protein